MPDCRIVWKCTHTACSKTVLPIDSDVNCLHCSRRATRNVLVILQFEWPSVEVSLYEGNGKFTM